MKQICDDDKCTGCSTCANICGKYAIAMCPDKGGFIHPVIDDNRCIGCGLCDKVCPANHEPEGHEHKAVYAAFVKDEAERAKSTSGGVFACLAQLVLKDGGYIYGAVMDEDWIVRHIEAVDENGLDRIRNSKYVQSEVGLCYQQVKKRLEEGKKVLFSGTPCQVAGLRNYLKFEPDNLLTVDILCHGVPSPEMFKRYVSAEEARAGSRMKQMQFRSKIVGWKKIFTVRIFEPNNEADWGDTFVPGFLKDLYLRESCYQCPYASDKRQGDITLGDFWGYLERFPEYIEDDDKGISLVIVNTDKGAASLRKIKRKLVIAHRTMEDAKGGNPILSRPNIKPQVYDDFWNDAKTMSWDMLSRKYIPEQDVTDWMSVEQRNYYAQAFKKRYWKHWAYAFLRSIYHKFRGFIK